jgi:hypothetical protein
MIYIKNRNDVVLSVPDWQSITYEGLKLVGNKTFDWNESMQHNFIHIVDRLARCETYANIPDTIINQMFDVTALHSEKISAFIPVQDTIINQMFDVTALHSEKINAFRPIQDTILEQMFDVTSLQPIF